MLLEAEASQGGRLIDLQAPGGFKLYLHPRALVRALTAAHTNVRSASIEPLHDLKQRIFTGACLT